MNPTSNVTPITPLREAIRAMHCSVSSWYDRSNPTSPRYDEDLPKAFKIGRNSFVVTEELDACIQKKIASRAEARNA
jgi:predicted DNA-binding transcriptional regulator AlpA